MDDSPSPPKAISHKQLNSLLKNASSGSEVEHTLNDDTELTIQFTKQLDTFEKCSQDILNSLSSHKDDILTSLSSDQSMALGVLQVHLKMALQASKAIHEKE